MFKPHPKDHDAETIRKQTRYIKTTAIATGTLIYESSSLYWRFGGSKPSNVGLV